MKNRTLFWLFIVIVIFAVTGIRSIRFKQNCSGYLKQCANASSITLALDRLNLAIDYLEKNNLTTGYTSILWKTEDDNITFFYNNLKDCQQELIKVADASQLEQTNVLMKVREVLTDEGQYGTKLVIPNGLSRYPFNTLFAILFVVGIIGLFILMIDFN